MCYCILEVRYRNKTEPDGLITISDSDALSKRLSDLLSLETVERVRIFAPVRTHERVSTWEVTTHD